MEKRLFVNVSNHPSDLWGSRQIESAQKYGTIVDIPFPKVDANADESEIRNIAEQKYNEILQVYRNSDGEFEEKGSSQYGAAVKGLTVMVQGEFTVTYLLVGLLKELMQMLWQLALKESYTKNRWRMVRVGSWWNLNLFAIENMLR